MAVPEAVWCVVCGAVPDVAVTVDLGTTLAHYGACWDHVGNVAARARRETARPPQRHLSGPVLGVQDIRAIEGQADG